jgi:hypothetical protein
MWAAARRRTSLRRRGRQHLAPIDPWSVPEPWRGYTTRALDARKRFHRLVRDCPPGIVAEYLSGAVAKVDGAVEEQWALVRSGAALEGPPGRAQRVAEELAQVQADLLHAGGADRSLLASREEALASQLRSVRHTEAVSAQVSGRLSALCAQLEGVVAAGAGLVVEAGEAGADLAAVSSELASLSGALEEARRMMATPPPGLDKAQ